MTTIASTLRTLERVAPLLAAETAYALWVSPGKRVGVHPSERAVMEDARASFHRIREHRVAVYEWGSGSRTVLLVHGWQSRASAFAPLVRELRATGRRVIAFDAPGNGRSSGRRTDIRDYAAIIAELEPAGGYEAIVAHSMGAPAAALAIRDGVRTGRLATINGAADFDYLLTQFGRRLGLTSRMLRAVRARTERRLFRGTPDPWRTYSATGVALPASIPWLLLHDEDDAMIEISQAHALLAANPGATPVFTQGLGHNRPLREDSVLDRIAAFVDTAAA
ncbi:MAG TPA: alpha/beta hydrolase [Pseudolysinimonas sp.]|nr:alpha/beta hydrolase [Pseudolysinimonas sp.]